MKNIKIGKSYTLFDNGVISGGHEYKVTVLDIIPFNKMREYNQEVFELWEEEKGNSPYNISTDFFIKTICEELEGNDDANYDMEDLKYLYFVEAENNSLWSLGLYAGVLDVDGNLTKQFQQQLLEDGFITFEVGNRKVFSYKFTKNNVLNYTIFIYIDSVLIAAYYFVNESNFGDLIKKLHLYQGDTFIQHLNF